MGGWKEEDVYLSLPLCLIIHPPTYLLHSQAAEFHHDGVSITVHHLSVVLIPILDRIVLLLGRWVGGWVGDLFYMQ